MVICPHDLVMLDKDGSETGHAMKAYNQEPEQCWECYSCVKICPQQATEVRHYADRAGPTNLNNPLSGFPAHSGHDTPRHSGEPHEQTYTP